MEWTVSSAIDRVLRNADVKEVSPGVYFIKNGSAGIRTLGAIDFLNKQKDIIMTIIDSERFKQLQKGN